jgi:vacuolar protein sorting-associated protein 33A
MFWLEPGPLSSTTTNIVYLCRPQIKHIKNIAGKPPALLSLTTTKPQAEQIKMHSAEGQKHVYNLILTPRTSTLASRILEEEGVLGEVTISSYNLQFIPLEEDVLSLEHDNAFKEIWLVRPFSCTSWLKRSLKPKLGRGRDGSLQFCPSTPNPPTAIWPIP